MPRTRRGILVSVVGSIAEELKIENQLQCSVDELICFCLARQVTNGDVVALGLATPLGAVAALLAHKLHAPEIFISSAIATSVTVDPPGLSLTDAEGRWIEAALTSSSFVTAAADYLPAVRPKEFFRPGQVDQHGNTNNVSIGRDYRRPRLRMPGVGGVPDVSVFMSDMKLYVPRHSRIAFPAKVDFLSGLGHSAERRAGSGPDYLVSDLGQFDFKEGRMRLTHLHPGVDLDRVLSKTAFEVELAETAETTALPSEQELEVLRKEVDPLGLRRLEILSGSERRSVLREIVGRDGSQRSTSR